VEPSPQKQQNGDRVSIGAEAFSDSSSELSDSRYETPFTSSPLPTPLLSKELPRSTRSKHAATFDPGSLNNIPDGSRKRLRSNSTADKPSKAPRISWKSSHRLSQSSPTFARQRLAYHDNTNSFVSEADTIPVVGRSPTLQRNSEDGYDPDLPIINVPNASSSMISSSPPRTPPQNRSRVTCNGEKAAQNGEDGADLLLYLANSPTPANFGGKRGVQDFLPSTPPSQHPALPSLTSTPGGGVTANFGTPIQQFNFADFVNVTPSPAQLPWGGRTPGAVSKTPRAPKEMKKRLNFDCLVPPSTDSSSKDRDKTSGLVLQLGEELRP
jgi:hypothetical protein